MSEFITEAITNSQSLPELTRNYQETTAHIVQSHVLALDGLNRWVADFQTSGRPLSDFMQVRTGLIGAQFSEAQADAQAAIEVVPQVLESLDDFAPADSAELARAFREPHLPDAIARIKAHGSDAAVKAAMRAALDARVLRAVRQPKLPDNARDTIDIYAADDNSREAMHIVADGSVWTQMRMAPDMDSAAVYIETAHSPAARDALSIAMAQRVFREGRATSSQARRETLLERYISDEADRSVLAAALIGPPDRPDVPSNRDATIVDLNEIRRRRNPDGDSE